MTTSGDISTQEFTINDRTYRPPARPIVVICIDGCADEYLSISIAKGRMPNVARIAGEGYRGLARGALPSFTNVNNSSICTGVTPAVHGICGNFFLDPDTGEEVMMNSAKYLRAETILAAAANAGRKVAMVTAKEKLRDILSHNLTGIAFSAEKANEAQMATHGIDDVEELVGAPTPEIYSGDASLYVLQAGAALVEQGRADFLYLSLTDFMQHKFDPWQEESLEFHAGIDREIGRLLDAGAIVAATADHGMNAKQKTDGSPNVIYLEPLLTEEFDANIKVILPITDPYVAHHGALGSLAMVHLPDSVRTDPVISRLMEIDGITEVHCRASAVRKLELAPDRIGDLVVLSGRDVVLGRSPGHHDLKAVASGLRSHGGRYEEMVPLLVSEPLNDTYRRKASGDPRNFDVFDFAVNGTGAEA
ncbi:Phosphonoacetate hydrolase [Symmachiella macrocystis]|uniref:Phosphonoacetate hydrolase n=1 Tax=Symmachiella macrocystis TaxID=2527985 RepID=A0A5C6BII7_9PLAN|nr:phosphonoacetate hydrolase [Symmachiella macrocystis]TWU11522.1 Phosphonoacetate hydrolase [Symmachiella macrocystis]